MGIKLLKEILLFYIVMGIHCEIDDDNASNVVMENASGCYANLCNYTANYPYEEIKLAIEKYPHFKPYFGVVLDKSPYRFTRSTDDNKAGICEVKQIKIHPDSGRDKQGNYHKIVNTKELEQEIIIQRCLNEKCMQKYKLRELVIINEEGILVKKQFKIPAGCHLPRSNRIHTKDSK